MKKLLMMALVTFSLGCMAATQYVAGGSNFVGVLDPGGAGFYLQINADAEGPVSVYIKNYSLFPFDANISNTNIAWFDRNEGIDSATEFYTAGSIGDDGIIYVGDFFAGDEIAFLLSSEDYSSYLTTYGEPSEIFAVSGTGSGLLWAHTGVFTNVGYTLEFYEGIPAPSGQPLPGVLASLLIGGGALGFLKLKKRK